MNFHPRSFAFLNSLVLKSFSPLSTRQRSAQLSPAVMLQPLSTSLQGGLRFVCPLCPAFPYALRLRFYPGYLLEIIGRERRASTFHVNDNIAGLGSSCLPTDVPVSAALNTDNLPVHHFGTERIILFFAPYFLRQLRNVQIF